MELSETTVKAIGGVLAAIFTLITVLVEKARRDNSRDHNIVRERLDMIKENVEHVREDLREDVRDIKGDIRELRVEFHDHLFNDHYPKRD
jgi:hypothetical protein